MHILFMFPWCVCNQENNQYLIVELHSFSIITLCLCLQGRECYWLCTNLAAKDSPDYIIISQRPVKSTKEYESVKNWWTWWILRTFMREFWTYLARWIHLSVSGGSSRLPRARFEGGSSDVPVPWSKLSSSNRMPMGCCRLARQLALTRAGSTPRRALWW